VEIGLASGRLVYLIDGISTIIINLIPIVTPIDIVHNIIARVFKTVEVKPNIIIYKVIFKDAVSTNGTVRERPSPGLLCKNLLRCRFCLFWIY
jgi:hypothetical protein